MKDCAGVVRVALVGVGGHGLTIRDAVRATPGLQVRGVYDPDEGAAQAAAGLFGCAVSASYEALLAREDLEAVVLVTPNALHRSQAEAAFRAGLDVFVDKPLANTVADGRAMVDAAEAAGRLLMVGHNMRRGRAARMVKQWLSDRRIGRLVSIDLHFSTDTAARLSPTSWRLQPDACPLLPVMQLGIHAIDLVHYWQGPVAAVQVFTASVTTPPEVVDSVAAAFRTHDGVLGTLVSNYCTPVVFSYRLAGTDGVITGTPHRCVLQPVRGLDARGEGEGEAHDFTAYDLEFYDRQMAAFDEAVRTRIPPETDGHAGLQALAVVEALHQAAETGLAQTV